MANSNNSAMAQMKCCHTDKMTESLSISFN